MIGASPGPLLVAHRGGAPGEVENSAAAFEHALSLDVDMLEFDVRQAGDRQLVLWHDPVLYAAGRRWVVQDTPLDQLRDLVPSLLTLDDYLERFGHQRPFNLDLKTHGFEPQVVASLERHDLIDHALISSGHTHSLRRLARLRSDLQRGLSRGHAHSALSDHAVARLNRVCLAHALPWMLRLARANAAMIQYGLASRELVDRLHRSGYRVFAWTIDDDLAAPSLIATGVDGITSNRPEWIRPVLKPAHETANTTR